MCYIEGDKIQSRSLPPTTLREQGKERRIQLESRGFGIKAEEAQAVQLAGGQQVLIPFGENAHLVWTRTNGQTAAVGLIRQGNKTLNISATGEERSVRFLPVQKVEKLVRKLREKNKFQEFEGKLAQKGKRVGKMRVLFDETNKVAILGIANEGDDKKIAHQVRIKLKADKDDEPEDDAEPTIQATACGQATGEAVPEGAKMQPLAAPPGEGDFEGGYEGPQICTSQWGYDYLCLSRTLAISLSTTSLTLPQTFITQQTQASFIIWNSGGGTLTGTVSAPAPFSIASGASFSLLPGQPQEVVVRFSSATAGSFSKSLSISSNGGSKTVTATAVAHKVSFSSAQLDFGSGLFLVKVAASCRLEIEIGDIVCHPASYIEKVVGLPQERILTVKNEGNTTVALTLNTSVPFSLSSGSLTLTAGQSAQIVVKFNPTGSGSFTEKVQAGIQNGQGSLTSGSLTGVAHKLEIIPEWLDFGIAFIGETKELKLHIKNHGVTTVPLITVSTEAPFSIRAGNSFTLAPSESQAVTVLFSPTTSGSYDKKLALSIGTSTEEIRVTGVSATEEEYLQMLINAFNIMAQQGSYSTLFRRYDEHIVTIAGLSQLDPSTFSDISNTLLETINADPLDEDPRLQQFFAKLTAIDPIEMTQWLNLLKEAYTQGRFDEEYNILLSQGLGAWEIALREIADPSLDSSTVAQVAKDILYALVSNGWQPSSFDSQQQDPNVVLNDLANFLRRMWWWSDLFEGTLRLAPIEIGILCGTNPVCFGGVMLGEGFWLLVVQKLEEWGIRCGSWGECVNKFINDTRSVLQQVADKLGADTASSLALAIKALSEYYFRDGVMLSRFGYWGSMWSLVKWMGEGIIDAQNRRGTGTILVAHGLASNGWENRGFISKLYPDGTQWWGTLSYNWVPSWDIIGGHAVPTREIDMALVSGGDHCANCAAKANDIVKWVGQAIEIAQEKSSEVGEYVSGVVSFGFTRQGATGVYEVVAALEAVYSDSLIPIVVSWVDSSGQVWYVCIGATCDSLVRSGKAARIACNQQGQRDYCGARNERPGSSAPPPPPDDSGNGAVSYNP